MLSNVKNYEGPLHETLEVSICHQSRQIPTSDILQYGSKLIRIQVAIPYLYTKKPATISNHSLATIDVVVLRLTLGRCVTCNLFVIRTHSLEDIFHFVESRIKTELHSGRGNFLYTTISAEDLVCRGLVTQ